jgi:YD repeat-containing protein
VVTTYDYDAASGLDMLAHGFTNAASNLTLEFNRNAASQIIENEALERPLRLRAGGRDGDEEPRRAEPNRERAGPAGELRRARQPDGGRRADLRLQLGQPADELTGGGRSYGFSYDAVGRLREVTATGLAARSYAWDGNDAILTYQGGNFLLRTVYGPGEKEPLYQLDNQGRRVWFVQDERGSTIAGSDPRARLRYGK